MILRGLGSVTLVKSNAKALLTASYQKCNLHAGFALFEEQERLFEKSPLHPAKTFTLAAKAEGQVVNLPLAGVA